MQKAIRYIGMTATITIACGVMLFGFQRESATNRWVAAGRMQAARAGACSVPLSNGRLLIMGGEGSGGVLNSAEIFDSSGKFAAVTSMGSAHANHVCALLDDGRV